MFLPYSLDLPYRQSLDLRGYPFFTMVFGVACIVIFTLQVFSELAYKEAIINYCQNELTASVKPILEKLGSESVFDTCVSFMVKWDINYDSKSLDFFAYKAQLSLQEEQILANELKRFNLIVVDDPLTAKWWHNPLNSNLIQYITSSFLHADWKHLLFNLIFFFAFSVTIEKLIGSVFYLAFFLLCCYTTGVAYESGVFGVYGYKPTIGLSGVVAGLMALTAFVYPLKKMKVFVWVLVLVTTVRVPVILIVGFYIFSDVYGLAYLTEESNINYVSHLAGSVTGLFGALLYYAFKYFRRNEVGVKGLEKNEDL